MTSARPCATPDLTALLCLMGGAVREAMAVNLMMQLLLIGTFNPAFGHVFKTWLAAEEPAHAAGDAALWYDLADDGDDDDGADETRIVPIRRLGLVLMWRHVTRFGSVMVIPLARIRPHHPNAAPVAGMGWIALYVLSHATVVSFFCGVLPGMKNRALFVTISK